MGWRLWHRQTSTLLMKGVILTHLALAFLPVDFALCAVYAVVVKNASARGLQLVRVDSGQEQWVFVLRPNCSMNWQQNKRVLWAMALWCGAIGLGFTLLGAWPVMPFVGLELMALAAGLYYVSWKSSHQQVLRFGSDGVVLEQGVHRPKKIGYWPRRELRVQIAMARHPDQVPCIQLSGGRGQPVRIGEFLNQPDCEDLITQLQRTGITLRRCDPSGRLIA